MPSGNDFLVGYICRHGYKAAQGLNPALWRGAGPGAQWRDFKALAWANHKAAVPSKLASHSHHSANV